MKVTDSTNEQSSREAQAQRTREALCSHARELFVERGYADTSLSAIVSRAGVTKGALYHHFPDKLELYRAVVEDIEKELARRVEDAAHEVDDPWGRLQAICSAYLDACLESDDQRVLIVDAPMVLGWKAWCNIEKKHGFGALSAALHDVVAAGAIADQHPDVLAQVLRGALNTAARVIVESGSPREARDMVGASIDRLLAGLRS